MIARQKCRLFIISVSIYISWPTDVAIAPTSGYCLSFSVDAATFLKPVFCISLCSINAPSALVCRLDDDQDSVPEPTPGCGTNVCLRVTHVYESHPSPRTSRVSHGKVKAERTVLTRVGGMWRVPCDTREVRGLGCDSYTWVTRRHTSVTRPGVDSGTES